MQKTKEEYKEEAWQRADKDRADRGYGTAICRQCHRTFHTNRVQYQCGRDACKLADARFRVSRAKKSKLPPTPRLCDWCKKSFIPDPTKPATVFCSDECAAANKRHRQQQYYTAKRAVTSPPRELICPECHTQFTTTHSQQIFCSRKCADNAKAKRARNKAPHRTMKEVKTMLKELESHPSALVEISLSTFSTNGVPFSDPQCTPLEGLRELA